MHSDTAESDTPTVDSILIAKAIKEAAATIAAAIAENTRAIHDLTREQRHHHLEDFPGPKQYKR